MCWPTLIISDIYWTGERTKILQRTQLNKRVIALPITLLLLFLLPPSMFSKACFKIPPFCWECSLFTLLMVLLGLSALTPYLVQTVGMSTVYIWPSPQGDGIWAREEQMEDKWSSVILMAAKETLRAPQTEVPGATIASILVRSFFPVIVWTTQIYSVNFFFLFIIVGLCYKQTYRFRTPYLEGILEIIK